MSCQRLNDALRISYNLFLGHLIHLNNDNAFVTSFDRIFIYFIEIALISDWPSWPIFSTNSYDKFVLTPDFHRRIAPKQI